MASRQLPAHQHLRESPAVLPQLPKGGLKRGCWPHTPRREHFSALGAADIALAVTLLDAGVSRRQRAQLAQLTARALREDLGFAYTTVIGTHSIALQPLHASLPSVDVLLRCGQPRDSRRAHEEDAAANMAFLAAVCLNGMQHLYNLPKASFVCSHDIFD